MLTERMLTPTKLPPSSTSNHQSSSASSDHLCIGDIFLYLGPFLKIYSVYARNYQNAIKTASELERKNSVFASFLRQRLRSPECAGKGLQAYILAPVQRIPRYKLLLEDLLKHTPTDHPDYSNLQQALNQIESVARYYTMYYNNT